MVDNNEHNSRKEFEDNIHKSWNKGRETSANPDLTTFKVDEVIGLVETVRVEYPSMENYSDSVIALSKYYEDVKLYNETPKAYIKFIGDEYLFFIRHKGLADFKQVQDCIFLDFIACHNIELDDKSKLALRYYEALSYDERKCIHTDFKIKKDE